MLMRTILAAGRNSADNFTWNFTVLLKAEKPDTSLLASPHAFINKSL